MSVEEIVLKSFVTFAFLWTVFVVYIIFNVDSETKWARWVLKAYLVAWLYTALISVLGAIWTN